MKKKTKSKAKSKVKTPSKPKTTSKANSTNSRIMPLGSRILLRPFRKEELETKSNFGIILPDVDSKEKSEQGVVLAVGPGEMHDGKRIVPTVKVGDKVAFSKYGFEDITLDGEELYLIKEENILAILK